MQREETIRALSIRARQSESAMIRVLSYDEIEWLVEPLLPALALVPDESQAATA